MADSHKENIVSMTFDDIYDLIANSEPMPYETWKYLVDLADTGTEIATDAAAAAISTAFPIVGTIVVWLAGQGLKWTLKQILKLVPHWSKPMGGKVKNIPGREVPLYIDGAMPLSKIKKIDTGTGTGLMAIAPPKPIGPPLTIFDGFQKEPIPVTTIPATRIPQRWTEQGRDYIPPSSIYGNRVPNIFVNRVGFTSF